MSGAVNIYPQFLGRLGNNLYQIAACIGYATRHNVGWGIQKGYHDPGFKVNQVDRFMPHLPSSEGVSYRRYDEGSRIIDHRINNYDYQEIPFIREGVRLVGFWQSYKYFDNAVEQVKRMINLPFLDGYKESCAVHVRRGDFVGSDNNFPPVTIEYFKLAIPMMIDRGYRVFVVCSDGIEWAENIFPQTFKGVPFVFHKGNEWEDMSVMGSCGSQIISNSSMAWWSAWLNPNEGKHIIAPHHLDWYGRNNGVVMNARERGKLPCVDLIPDSWTQIKFR